MLTWSSAENPCIFWRAPRSQLHELDGATPTAMPHALKTHDDYLAACEAAEHVRTLSREEHALVVRHASFDKRRSGYRGLAIMRAIPSLGLVAGDRIDPTEDLPDVDDFFGFLSFL